MCCVGCAWCEVWFHSFLFGGIVAVELCRVLLLIRCPVGGSRDKVYSVYMCMTCVYLCFLCAGGMYTFCVSRVTCISRSCVTRVAFSSSVTFLVVVETIDPLYGLICSNCNCLSVTVDTTFMIHPTLIG